MEWRGINGFPGYSVNRMGDVRNDVSGRMLRWLVNQRDFVYVGLIKDGEQYARSVSRIVAEAFLPEPVNPSFDTVINLDGDRKNNQINNLMWRPRWFAVKYHRQLRFRNVWPKTSILEVETGEIFEGPMDAAVRFGILAVDIQRVARARNHNSEHPDKVWPTGQLFCFNT